eukprot:2318663-Rhodomonas_salina.3
MAARRVAPYGISVLHNGFDSDRRNQMRKKPCPVQFVRGVRSNGFDFAPARGAAGRLEGHVSTRAEPIPPTA